ncbi:DUF202 domain-containing protein [Microbacterium sp. KR10-403]|uniref:DUF202 domain-containing protein n=1 Tax=Microbacterium sp. KR10-403 TaxID=3158581 RepID=UPI0032E49232
MTAPGPVDVGLQIERTTLAWRRTGLAIAVGSLVAMRLLPELMGGLAWAIPGAVGVLASLWMWWMSRRRHHAFVERAAASGSPRIGGAGPLCAIAVGSAAIGLFGLVLAIVVG